MQKNISAQLKEALGLLKDYPGIADILNLKAAEEFLLRLSKSKVAQVPDFKEISSEQVDALIKEDQNSVDEWMNALNSLKGVGANKDDAGDCVIFGGVTPDLARFQSETDEGELYFSFKTSNQAEFNDKTGTWAEIYLLIVKHVNENLIVPVLPEN